MSANLITNTPFNLVCPDCRHFLNQFSCEHCGWSGVPTEYGHDMLDSKYRKSQEQNIYANIYETLAQRNLVRPELTDHWVDKLAESLIDMVTALKGLSCLDVGAGRGYLIEKMRMRGAKVVVAVDISSTALRHIRGKYACECIKANAETLPFVKQFDLITATDVLEHVLNISNCLTCLNWSLKPEGVLLIRVPYLENMSGYSTYNGLPFPYTHLRTFDKKTICALLEDFGFTVLKTKYSGFRPNQTYRFFKALPSFVQKACNYCTGTSESVNAQGGIFSSLAKRACLQPVEISVLAVKKHHLETGDYYRDLRAFIQQHSL